MSFGFGKKKTGTSPGGSVIFKYDAPGKLDTRFSDLPALGGAEARQAVYSRLFGDFGGGSGDISREFQLTRTPEIDVLSFKGGQKGRDFCTIVTSGMSDCPMNLDHEATGKASKRVELIFYCVSARPEYVETLRWLAHFPHDYKTWLGVGHTIPNGNPPAPMWNSRVLDTVLFMPTIVSPDNTVSQKLTVGGDPVQFLWVVPLSKAECHLKLAHGLPAVLELFDRHRHPHVFNPDRGSYC